MKPTGAARNRQGNALPSIEGGMRRVFLLVAAVLLVDTAFYAAIVPLLPHYTDELGLSQTGAGVLTASYAATMAYAVDREISSALSW